MPSVPALSSSAIAALTPLAIGASEIGLGGGSRTPKNLGLSQARTPVSPHRDNLATSPGIEPGCLSFGGSAVPEHSPQIGLEERIRTSDLTRPKRAPYQAWLLPDKNLVRPDGFEPSSPWLRATYSSVELRTYRNFARPIPVCSTTELRFFRGPERTDGIRTRAERDGRANLERPRGFKPRSFGWKPKALSLDDGRSNQNLVLRGGIEPPTPDSSGRRSTF